MWVTGLLVYWITGLLGYQGCLVYLGYLGHLGYLAYQIRGTRNPGGIRGKTPILLQPKNKDP